MRLIFFGPPGSGKGTYASKISSQLGIAHIATGDIFREAIASKDELGKKVENYLKSGKLVPDEIVIEIIKERIKRKDCEKGFIFDGYPRTIAQAKALDEITTIDAVINLKVSEKIIIDRLSGRRICAECGAIYHIKYVLPKKQGVCDRCGGKLYQRKDDTPAVIKERLNVYARQTEPLIKYYKDRKLLIDVECKEEVKPEDMVKRIYKVLEGLRLLSG